jgi:hypothetical protein
MKDAVVKMYEEEVRSLEWLIERNPYWFNLNESIDKAVQRCLGIAQFVQTCPNGLKYEEIELLYEKTKRTLESYREGI